MYRYAQPKYPEHAQARTSMPVLNERRGKGITFIKYAHVQYKIRDLWQKAGNNFVILRLLSFCNSAGKKLKCFVKGLDQLITQLFGPTSVSCLEQSLGDLAVVLGGWDWSRKGSLPLWIVGTPRRALIRVDGFLLVVFNLFLSPWDATLPPCGDEAFGVRKPCYCTPGNHTLNYTLKWVHMEITHMADYVKMERMIAFS